MSERAWVYFWSILIAGAVLAALTLPGLPRAHSQWILFGSLLVLATAAQLFKALAPNHQSFYASLVFFFAGVLLLHPFLVVLVTAIPHLIEWAKERKAPTAHLSVWYVQPFNIAMLTIAGLSARWVYVTLCAHPARDGTPWSVVAVLLAVLTYVTVNHALLGQALVLARGVSWRDSGVLATESVVTDAVLLCLGGVVALLWQLNPWMIALALSPLILIYRALMIPQLEQEARSDAKTGLWNARHFNTLFTAELDRAGRFHRPLAVIMADLDLMRNINNTYGHLAGDTVLASIGKIIRANVRQYDIPGRFGGEEFAIVLLEIQLADARMVAERIRRAVEAEPIVVASSPVPIHVTMSMGIAHYPDDGTTLTELTHAADVAVYQAKAHGRNRVICAADLPPEVVLEQAPAGQSTVKPPNEPPAAMPVDRWMDDCETASLRG